MYCGAEYGGFFPQQLFQPLCHRGARDWLAIFREPNQVVFLSYELGSVGIVFIV
jgi:hypothetical protein